jgi:hypothetical protein
MFLPSPGFLRRALLAGLLFGLTLPGCGPSDSPGTNTADPPSSLLDSLSTTPADVSDRGAPARLVRSQTLYVPAYSHIYFRDAQRSINLTTTLSIRNTSPDSPLTLSTIEYYDSNGEHVRNYLDAARTLGPLASTSVVVEESDLRGGVGANFIVRWHADQPVPPPVVETVMITTQSTQGISFRTTARVLYEDRAAPSGDTIR